MDAGTRDGAAEAWPVEERPVPVAAGGTALSARGARTREALLAAAEEVFGELGYHEASVVKITQAAGVAQGTFYRYFASKQAIFDELVTDLNRRVRRAMSEGAARGRSRAEAERYGFEAYFRFTDGAPGLNGPLRVGSGVPIASSEALERKGRACRPARWPRSRRSSCSSARSR